MKFYLGAHEPSWLWRAAVPLFVSRRTLARRTRRSAWPRAVGSWALDSGGFTELLMFQRWTLSAAAYAAEVRDWREQIGGLDFAAPQDWMCEPQIIRGGQISGQHTVGTGLSVLEHQRLTVDNYLELRTIAPDLPWMPVLQGWAERDYLVCLELYDRAGVDLRAAALVGLGSVCRRSREIEGAQIVRRLVREGLRLHGFGFKLSGLALVGRDLASADSLAWSYAARRGGPCPLPGTRKNCANCLHYALDWRSRLLRIADPPQLRLFG